MSELISKDKEVPLVEVALAKILDRFEVNGYGVVFDHPELSNWMGIRVASSINEVKKEQLEYMTGVCKIKDRLSDDYNLCLHSVQGHGYSILHPDDQVNKGADYYLKKSQKALTRFAKTLNNIDVSELSIENRSVRANKVNRAVFIKAAYRRRRLPVPKETKAIE